MVLTDWDEFKDVDMAAVTGRMRAPLIIDPSGVLGEAVHKANNSGITYCSIGK